MKTVLVYIFFFTVAGVVAQIPINKKPATKRNDNLPSLSQSDTSRNRMGSSATFGSSKDIKATIDQYKIITIFRDTTMVDTSLTIKKEYEHNYLRKDHFGLLPFANEGQPYTVLDFGRINSIIYPEFGFRAKHSNYMQVEDIKYYSVPTPYTDLYYKTVMEQGQNLDAFITLNTSPRLNYSVAYKGLRSLGKYVNQLSSTGNFRFSANYRTRNGRYVLLAHFTAQDILNRENGGIVSVENFESGDGDFANRVRLDVYMRDAQSLLRGNRYFFDHKFRLKGEEKSNNKLWIAHQFNYEHKFYEYKQGTLPTTVNVGAGNQSFLRFGDAFVNSNINDKTRYNRMYNKIGTQYESALFGLFEIFLDDYRYNYFYNRTLIMEGGIIPSGISDRINSFGGRYSYQKKQWHGNFQFTNAISNQRMSSIEGNLKYDWDSQTSFKFQYQSTQKLPDLNYLFHQSSYLNYNWFNNFVTEKNNTFKLQGTTKWFESGIQWSTMSDYLYFSNDALPDENPSLSQLLVSPKQYGNTINYFSIKFAKEIRLGKWALDNTVLYQKVDQGDPVLNVPEWLTRNTLYFSNHFFKKALYLQTGVTFQYFTSYYADDYNPVLGEFFVQNQRSIGNYPVFDYFVNAKIRTFRAFLKFENVNSLFGKDTYFSAPNYPYRDFIFRFGLTWNFFQ